MTLAILQARTSSSRLPGKVLSPILGRPMILHQLDRLKRAKTLDGIVVATSDDPSDDALAAVVAAAGVAIHRGSLDDVLGRFVGALDAHAPGSSDVARLTGDCPLIDPVIVDEVVRHHRETGADYTSNALIPSFPNGLETEVVKASILRLAAAEADLVSEREHVMPFIWKRPDRFRLAELRAPVDRSHLRWTVDTPADLILVTAVFEALYPSNPQFDHRDVLALFARDPYLEDLNGGQTRNAGYARSIAEDRNWIPPPSSASTQ